MLKLIKEKKLLPILKLLNFINLNQIFIQATKYLSLKMILPELYPSNQKLVLFSNKC